jgi:energy-coupling factor transporter ATP-binding protein EcfA2
MQVQIKNWRCIEEVEFDLSKINIFLGQNATGKSSLAYALYLLSKAPKNGVEKTLNMLYGLDVGNLVRVESGNKVYPAEIKTSDYHLIIDKKRIHIPDSKLKLWSDEFLLPSRRVAYFQALRFLPRIVREFEKKPESKTWIPLVISFFKPIIEELPLFPPAQIFFSDLNRVLTGYRIEPIKGSLKSLGDYLVEITPLMSLFTFMIRDPFTELELPAEISPDGQVDQMLVDLVLGRCPKESLIVIEEPEIYKNPVFQFEMMEKIVDLAVKKDLTVIITSHSEIIPLSIAKLVEEGKLKPDDVRIYYLTRSKEEPWTKIRKIEVYENGTLEELPDSEEVTARLF